MNSQPGRKTSEVKPCAAHAFTISFSMPSFWPDAKAWSCWSGEGEPAALEYIGSPMTGVAPWASGEVALAHASQLAFATHELMGCV